MREQQFPLRISLRDDASRSPIWTIEEVLRLEGVSLADVEAWGGTIQWLEHSPGHPDRLAAMRARTIDAVFDEGVHSWGATAFEAGFSFAALQDSTLTHMERLGWPILPYSARFPDLKEDHRTLSFSGWPLYTHDGLPDEAAYQILDALWTMRADVGWDTDPPIDLADLCRDAPATPLGMPLHPGAASYFREHGAL